MVQTMNTPAANPFTGLKAALTGLLSGGWRGLVMHLLFYRRISAALAALEALFAQFQAGTLPAAPAPAPQAPAQTPPRKTPTPVQRPARARFGRATPRRPTTALRRRPGPPRRPIRAQATTPRARLASPRKPKRDEARSPKSPRPTPSRTPYLLR